MIAAFRPDDSFFPSPRLAMHAPPEGVAYVTLTNAERDGQPDAVGVIDVNPRSRCYGSLVAQVDMPHAGDELGHLGWNACSSSLGLETPRPHLERRYLVVPGLRSSRIHVIDTRPDPLQPRIVKVIGPEAIARITGYSRPRAVRSAPGGVFVTALGAPDGEGPGGMFVLDPETLDVRGRWEIDRGPQHLAGDVGWHLSHGLAITSEWGTPGTVERGVDLDRLLAGGYGHRLHVWDLRRRAHLETLDLGAEHQLALELRPAHDPTRAYGFAGVAVSSRDLSASVWLWHRHGQNGSTRWSVAKVIEIPAVPAGGGELPPLLARFGVVPPLVTSLTLSMDDRFLYVSCWGTGELRQYDVSNPFAPTLTGTLSLGGILGRAAHPARPGEPQNGGPQAVEISRDGRRVYVTNSLLQPWDEQVYPDGIRGWMVKADAAPGGGMRLDERFYVPFGRWRPRQVRLEGGDASSDAFCYA